MYFIYDSPVGELTVVIDKNKLIGLYFEDRWDKSGELVPMTDYPDIVDSLDRYFAGSIDAFKDIEIDLIGSEYRMAVWAELLNIPYGKVISYKDISDSLKDKGIKSSAISVGGAVGANPISIIVPCHRVVGSSGALTGFGGGLETKRKLLELEGHNIDKDNNILIE